MSGVWWDGKDVGVAAGNEVKIDEEPIGGPPDIGQESVVGIVFFDVVFEPDDGPRGQKFIGAFTGLAAKALHRFSWVFGFWGVDAEEADAFRAAMTTAKATPVGLWATCGGPDEPAS